MRLSNSYLGRSSFSKKSSPPSLTARILLRVKGRSTRQVYWSVSCFLSSSKKGSPIPGTNAVGSMVLGDTHVKKKLKLTQPNLLRPGARARVGWASRRTEHMSHPFIFMSGVGQRKQQTCVGSLKLSIVGVFCRQRLSGQGVVTGVLPLLSPLAIPFVYIAWKAKRSLCPSLFHRCLSNVRFF